MARLTDKDVVLKKFVTTKFREGYDQVEVDDFLDEVAVSMREMAAENDELKAKLAAAEARIAELEKGGANAGTDAALKPLTSEAPPAPPAPAVKPDVATPLAAPFQAPPAPETPAAATKAPAEEESATGMLALARKLHDEYVLAGQEEGDQILSEAKAKAAGIIREAEELSDRTKSKLEQEQADLEREIEGLRIFERDYRTRLRTYLKNLLSDIDGSPAPGGTDALAS
jgi:DivIVA domain-containing protein